jgi:hypothetical protein
MLLTNNTKEIELFGKKLILSERTARDVNKLIAYSKKNTEKEFVDMLIEAAITIEDGLKNNFSNLRWYNIFKRYGLRKLLSKENLIANLSSSQLFDLSKQVYQLEGVEIEDEKKSPIQIPIQNSRKESVEQLQ